jgi:hypothetical protein
VLQQCQLLKGVQSSALLRIYLIMLMMTVKYYKQMCSLSLSSRLVSSRLVSSRVCIIIINIIIAGVVFLLRPSSSVETNTRRNSNNMLGLACFLGRERWEGGCLPAAAPIATC